MPSTVAIRHAAFDDLGTIQPVLVDAGHTIRYVDAGVGDHALACTTRDWR